jgi:Arc/MetJ family transcription regulator
MRGEFESGGANGFGAGKKMYRMGGTLRVMAATKPRIQVMFDDELAAAVAELGGAKPRSRAVRDLALRGAQAIREEQDLRQEALEFLRRLDGGEDDRFDFSVSAQLHAERG